ncbi:hypothetical protein C8R43DRAFT_1183219 [Mycena crocata]|nr:hypothetical protein C8R43DRAFT_1183219 [Mycena crocata]
MSVKTRNNVVGFVKSDKYNPAPLPVLQTVPRLASLAQREDFKSIGYGIVDGCVFISTVGSISIKPLGYSKFIRGIARHRGVLHAVIEKVDHQLVVDVANVGEGLAEFVGAQWLESGANLDEPEKSDLGRSFQWLRPVLEPVLRVAAEDFIKMHRLNEQDTAAWLIKRDARLPPGLQFFENVYQIQNRPPPQEPASPEFSLADSDGETDLSGVENLDKTELQHEADGDANKSASSGSDDDADDDEDDDVEADQDAEDDADDVEGDDTDDNHDANDQFEIAVDANSSSFDFSSSDISMRTADASTGSAPDALAADGTKIQTHHLVALAENIAAMAAAVPRSPVLRDSPGTGLNGIAPSDLHALFVSPPGISADMANWRLPSLSPNSGAEFKTAPLRRPRRSGARFE